MLEEKNTHDHPPHSVENETWNLGSQIQQEAEENRHESREIFEHLTEENEHGKGPFVNYVIMFLAIFDKVSNLVIIGYHQ